MYCRSKITVGGVPKNESLLSYNELSPAGESGRSSRGPACIAMVQIVCLISHGVRPRERGHRFNGINSTELEHARIDKFASVTQGISSQARQTLVGYLVKKEQPARPGIS